MNFDATVKSLLELLKDSDNLYFVLYAISTCLLTQIFKKLFVNKVKVDVLHKFDFAEILPYIFGVIFALIDLLFVKHLSFSFDFVAKLALSAVTIGALASVIFKFVSSLSGKNLKSLMKDDAFCVFYTQLLYFVNIRQKLVEKELTLQQFVSAVKSVSENAVEIYKAEGDEATKKTLLCDLLQQSFDVDMTDFGIDSLYNALAELISNCN